MLQLDTLGLPSRAGGVDHVGQVVRPRRRFGVVSRTPREIFIQQHQPRVVGQPADESALGQQHVRLTLLDHEAQPLFGMAWVEWQVGAAGFEDAQQADHHLE